MPELQCTEPDCDWTGNYDDLDFDSFACMPCCPKCGYLDITEAE